MRIVNKEIKVYKFDELSDEVKNKLIAEQVNFLGETTDFGAISKNSNLYKAYKECMKMQTPWFIGEYIWEYCSDMVLKFLRKYEYEENGCFFEE